MESVYIKSPKKLSLKKSKLASLEKSNKIFDWNSKNKKMPNLKGFDGQNVIPVLENAGFKINYSGIGKIIEQSIPAGQMIPENKVITLKLSNV